MTAFNAETTAKLTAPLNRAHVKERAEAGRTLSYIEGWRVIDEANSIFGFGGWTRETLLLEQTNKDLVELTGNNGPYQQWRVGYIAKVRITVAGVIRDGVGFGSGMGKPAALGDAIESAAKEAETDAMKRAFMTFGNPFGLALYDKAQSNVADIPPEPSPIVGAALAAITDCKTRADLAKWKKDNGHALQSMPSGPDYEAILSAFRSRLNTLTEGAPA